MDEYYIGRDEWEAILELGVGDNNGEATLKNIATATKTAFTRKFVHVPCSSLAQVT